MSLNPFGTGQCLPTDRLTASASKLMGLNPFGTGQCLPTMYLDNWKADKGLNPFGTGQCLPTTSQKVKALTYSVSIPLEQGSVFRPH